MIEGLGLAEQLTDARRRLVLVGAPSAVAADHGLQTTQRLGLVGVTSFEKTLLNISAWFDLLEGLWDGEQVHLVQTWLRAPGQPKQYLLEASLLQTLGARAGDSRNALLPALQTTLPQAVFRVIAATEVSADIWPTRAVFQLASTRLLSTTGSPQAGLAARLPYASAQGLPAWLLTAPFSEPFGQSLQMNFRFEARSLSPELRLQLDHCLRSLKAGSLRVAHPRAEPTPQNHDADLAERLTDLLTQWRQFPEPGYVFDIVVRSPEAVTGYALKRLGRDIFGGVPWDVQLVDEAPALIGGLASWPLKASQGLCGLFPGVGLLQEFGVDLVGVAPPGLPRQAGALVGDAGGQPVRLPFEHRTSHLCAVGGSGTGKSSFLLRLLAEDIQAGRGCGVIDPHGDLVDGLLSVMDPARRDDVVLIDVDDPEFSVALNPMTAIQGDARQQNFVASQLTDLIERLFETPDSSGPMLRNNLRNAFMLAMAHPDGGTIADVARIFEDNSFRDWLLSKADPRVREFFSVFAATSSSDHGYASWKPYLLARVLPFSQNPALMRMLGRPSTIDLGKLMDEKRIVLFRLSKSALQDKEVEALGSLILMQFHAAALARARVKPDQRAPFHLVVDEFHTFANDTTPTLLRESRKYGLGLSLATQSLSSLRRQRGGDLVGAVLANTASKVFFRLSSPDAALVDDYVEPTFKGGDLTRTRNHQAVMCLSATEVPAFLIRTLVADPVANALSVDQIRRASGARHATPLKAAHEYLARRHGNSLCSMV